MNTLRKKYTLLLTLIASMASILNAEETPIDWCMEVSSATCEEQTTDDYSTNFSNYNTEVFPEYEGDSKGFFVEGDLLVWRPHISNLELAFGNSFISQTTAGGVQTITTDEYNTDPRFKWRAGYRVAVGYQSNCNDWELRSCWTHFQDSGTRSSQEDTTTVNRGTCRLKFDQIDVGFAYNSSLSSSFLIKPFIGIRGTRIHEDLEAVVVTDITLPTGLATETRTFDDHQRFRGIGLVLGFEGDWDIGSGFGIYGNAAASTLYGNYRVRFNDSDILTAPISNQIFSNHRKRLHAFNCNVDLGVGLYWQTTFCESAQLGIKIGFEHHQYFNQSYLGVSPGDICLDGAVFSIGLSL